MKNLLSTVPLYLIALFIFSTLSAFSQDFAAVDKKVNSYPKTYQHFDKLAAQINSDFTRDDEKARAAFAWIALNVQYDVNLYKSQAQAGSFTFRTQEERIRKERQFDIDLALKTLRTKKAVCHGYTVLFNEIMTLSNIESVLIPGTSKTNPLHIGQLPALPDHAWNAVKLDGQWKFVDVTWGAGAIDGSTGKFMFKYNPAFFMTDPELFFLNHFPQDIKWLMVDKSAEQWAQLPLYYGDYLNSDYTFVSPSIGMLSSGQSVLKFKVNNLPNQQLTYAFSSERIVKILQPQRSGNTATFEIPVNPRATGYLTIFVDNKSVVTYKLDKNAS
jgi:transglutaminase/protease-like cytokinesis protein 3